MVHETNIKVILITMEISKVINSLIESGINIIGVIESKRKNTNKQTKEMENFCLENGLPYYFMNEGCNNRLENWVRKLEPDLVVINRMSELLKKNILEIPKKGCINLHPTLLPKYRGGFPLFWTYYNYDLNQGVTVHYIDEGEDTGDIIYQKNYRMTLGTTEEELLEDLVYKIGTEVLIKSILDIENNCAPRIKQAKTSPTVRARQIKTCEYKKIIDWEEWGIERIWHLLRGTQNWLNVFDFTEIQGEVLKWKILKYVKGDVKPQQKLGKVYKEEDAYFVYCRHGKIFMELSIEV
ncbi:methionyl-tRNA formyltransferase [Lysinibacillus contaminans]|uniref:methionyl-tRNA formyltransferase n=1 Tax=Lysinibacillus contaminans TaxID=1293441 RepID=UPI0006ADC153|nr:formyltransferase family protein [Lysinibacillus contaminans]